MLQRGYLCAATVNKQSPTVVEQEVIPNLSAPRALYTSNQVHTVQNA